MFELVLLTFFYLEILEANLVDDSGSGQLFPVSIFVSDPPAWSFVVINFGPATLDPFLLVGEVLSNHSPDRYLQQSVCSVSC